MMGRIWRLIGRWGRIALLCKREDGARGIECKINDNDANISK